MALRYAIRHRSTRRFLATLPSLGRVTPGTPLAVDKPEDAVHFETRARALEEYAALEAFVGAWEVTPVEIAMTEPPRRTVKRLEYPEERPNDWPPDPPHGTR